MEAVEFIRTLQKLCEGKGCDDCPLHDIDRCDVRYVEDPEETVRIVEEWGKEQDRQKQEQEQHKTEQEQQKKEHPEELSNLHAIIDSLEDRIDNLEKKVLDKYPVESINEPTVDAVEVVRCKDCTYYRNDTAYCEKHDKRYCCLDDDIKPTNHYCGYAEKK